MLIVRAMGGVMPSWARGWDGDPPLPGTGPAKVLTLADLDLLRPPSFRVEEVSAGLERFSGEPLMVDSDCLADLLASIRRTEWEQCQAALANWAAHLEETAARRLAGERLAWEERLRDFALRLEEENERALAEYAAEVRREYSPAITAVEMEMAMCTEPGDRQALESRLAGIRAEMEARIAQRREDLARESESARQDLRAQAEAAMTALRSSLDEENARALAAFAAAQEQAYAEWLSRNIQAEAAGSSASSWAFGIFPEFVPREETGYHCTRNAD